MRKYWCQIPNWIYYFSTNITGLTFCSVDFTRTQRKVCQKQLHFRNTGYQNHENLDIDLYTQASYNEEQRELLA